VFVSSAGLSDAQIAAHAAEVLQEFQQTKLAKPFFLAVGFHRPVRVESLPQNDAMMLSEQLCRREDKLRRLVLCTRGLYGVCVCVYVRYVCGAVWCGAAPAVYLSRGASTGCVTLQHHHRHRRRHHHRRRRRQCI
jgi:hypothetical protein